MSAVKERAGRSGIMRRGAERSLCLTVLCGGPSREREVSLQSGEAVARALESLGHDVHRADINPENLGALARSADAVFVALHGAFGEDGAVQEILERHGLPYTGSGPSACALAMNKAAAKQRLSELGLPTPRWEVVGAGQIGADPSAWTLPVVVKPVSEGSSIACHIVRDVIDLKPAAEQVVADYGEALIEEFIPGLEITVGILGDRALPAIEIRSAASFYDYEAKYLRDDTEYDFEIDLPAAFLERLGAMSLAAHRGLGCRDFSRVDWRVDPRGPRGCILEVNTIPGFTSHSLLPMAARRVGMEMPELCQRIVEMALERE